MAKRGYKLQEFVGHSGNVNCLNIGKKTCKLFVSGGDDHKVNLWSIGEPKSLTSLCGHTSPVESVTFDSSEVLVVAGSSAGVVKLWDLEETKMVRNLTGHRSYCTAVQFHPFGEFFASGSMDTNLKIWDIRKKGCIHTYKGHTRGISTIRFSPDGRWVVSGGLDNVVKVWDLTAGKLLHDFKSHEGHIRCIDFHPLEFLLATGSADKTVKFWDLETFELIGSARPEATGVRSITFNPDGRTLFCGFDDSLKVYSWEPVICHEAVDMGWSTLGDLRAHDGKILGCSHYEDSIGVWVADISLIEPYRGGIVPEQISHPEPAYDLQENPLEKVDSHRRSKSSLRSMSPDSDSGEIKNIYVDSGSPVVPKNDGSLSSPKVVVPADSKEIKNLQPQKPGPAVNLQAVVPSDSKEVKYLPLQKPSPAANLQVVVPSDSKEVKNLPLQKPSPAANLQVVVPSDSKEVKNLPPQKPGPAVDLQVVVPFDSKEVVNLPPPKPGPGVNLQVVVPSDFKEVKNLPPQKLGPAVDLQVVVPSDSKEVINLPHQKTGAAVNLRARSIGRSNNTSFVVPRVVPRDSPSSKSRRESLTATRVSTGTSQKPPHVRRPSATKFDMKSSFDTAVDLNLHKRVVSDDGARDSSEEKRSNINSVAQEFEKVSSPRTPSNPENGDESIKSSKGISSVKYVNGVAVVQGRTRTLVQRFEKKEKLPSDEVQTPDTAPQMVSEKAKTSPLPVVLSPQMVTETAKTSLLPDRHPQTSGRESTSNDGNDIEDLMQNHDVLLSTFRSRLTRLQVVRHFWERNDIKGAINAMRKLPDHSVQADVISILMDKMEILNLDLFSFLLPVLLSLLDSKIERHTNISLEMLLKLVAVFGPVVRSTVSAPPAVGVDLQAEQRRECCNQCFIELQKIQNILPALVRRGGLVAKSALELNLVLQQ